MTREQFHEALEKIELQFLSLGELAGVAVQRAVSALMERDEVVAEQVIADDDAIDDLYLSIDNELLTLLALQSPVATDLRLVSAIIHGCHHLERIGDQAVNIAKIYLVSREYPGNEDIRTELREMGDIVVSMIRRAMEGFRDRNAALVKTLPEMDDPVDRLNRSLHLEVLKLADDPPALDWGLHMVMVARALERVGDNAVDIGEQLEYLVTGEYREFEDASHVTEE
jgi:phosphate transport system protein